MLREGDKTGASAGQPRHDVVGVTPDGLGYRLKCLVLGPPRESDQLERERLGS